MDASALASDEQHAGREQPAAFLDNVVRHLLGISRDFEPRLLRTLQAHGHPGLRQSFARLLFLAWDEPRPLNSIADELGISAQAAGHTARLVEQVGYARLEPNPADRRSKLVVITERGRAVNDERGTAAIGECEDYYASLVGYDEVKQLGAVVVALWEQMNGPDRPTHLRTLIGVLPLVALKLRSDVHVALARRGHFGLKPSHHETVALLFPRGARASDIARAQGISRQAVGQTLRELEDLGYIGRRRDQADRRGVVFSLSNRGQTLVIDTVEALQELRTRLADLLGEPRLHQMEVAARRLALALQLDAAALLVRNGGLAPVNGSAVGDAVGGHASLVQLAIDLRQSLSPSDVALLAALLTAR